MTDDAHIARAARDLGRQAASLRRARGPGGADETALADLERQVRALFHQWAERRARHGRGSAATASPSLAETLSATRARIRDLAVRRLKMRAQGDPTEAFRTLAPNELAARRLIVLEARLRRLARSDAAAPPRAAPPPHAARARPGETPILIICNHYPSDDAPYRSAFVHRRVAAYREAGVEADVVALDGAVGAPDTTVFEDVSVRHLDAPRAIELLYAGGHRARVIHSPPPQLTQAALAHPEKETVGLWLHGYDTRDYARLIANFTRAELARDLPRLEAIHAARIVALRQAFADADLKKVFVSRFLRDMACEDVGVAPANAHLIPNIVDPAVFAPRPRTADDRARVLVVRPFTRPSYGADMAVDAIRRLSERAAFASQRFHVVGFGEAFGPLTEPLASMPNVTLQEGPLRQAEIARLHARHGVFLAPSRHDTQGVSACEAMGGGLVPVTQDVGGIPEFVDETCGLVVPADDAQALADAVTWLHDRPDAYLRLAAAAADRARDQCGPASTTERELALFGLP